MSTGEASYGQAVQSWLDEEKDYGGEKIGEGDFGKWGHFSELSLLAVSVHPTTLTTCLSGQCLWHSTTHVGMGKATSKEGSTFIVARYTPQGNMAGEKPF
jgi:hypothetical protein